MKHQSQLPPGRKALAAWTPSEISALFESAKKYRGDHRVAHIERSGISMGTFHRWRREAAEGNPVPNAVRPKSRQHSPEERAQICMQLAARPREARHIAREVGINVATLYAWRKQNAQAPVAAKQSIEPVYRQSEGPQNAPQKTASTSPQACQGCLRLADALELLAQALRLK